MREKTYFTSDLLFRFVVALARDLRDEFYVYLVRSEKSLFKIIFNLLNTKEPDQLEWTLITLAYLFKILKPYLKKDFSAVFNSLLPLIDDGRNAENITNFAVECFAFIVRDITEKEKFLTAILSKLNATIDQDAGACSDSLIRGCGQLLFEVIRGVNGQFHSCAGIYLHVYFGLLSKLNTQQAELLYEILSGMVKELIQHIAPANMQTYWDSCYHVLVEFKNASNFNSSAYKQLLLIMGQTLESKDGKFLTNSNQFVTELLKVIDTCENNDECLQCTSNLVTVLLLSHNVILTQMDASRITKKVLTIPSIEIFESFVWNCVKYSQFEVLILPEFLRYIDSNHFGLSSLELMAKIILYKSPLVGDGITLDSKKLYPIRLRSDKSLQKIKAIITNFDNTTDTLWSNSREFLLALIIYPHIVGCDTVEVLGKINESIEFCLNALKPTDGLDQNEFERQRIQIQNKRIIFVLSILIESLIQFKEQQIENSMLLEKISLQTIVNKLIPFSSCENHHYIHALRLLDLIISIEAKQSKKCRSSYFNLDLFKKIHQQLSNNLFSRYHTVRRTTAHLLHQFADELKTNNTEVDIYGVFFDIESIEANIHTYREQLLLLQRIEPNRKLLSSLCQIDEQLKLDPFKYLLGLLHVNFNLLWKPIMELIAAYFSELDIESFWSIYKVRIEETTILQRSKCLADDDSEDFDFIESESCLGKEYLNVWRNDERPIDLVNYRISLWRIIPSLGMLREIKNREIVTIFLDFIEHEYKRTIDRDTLTLQAQRKRKIKKTTKGKALHKSAIENENEDECEEDITEQILDDQNVPAGTQRTLTNMLQVFVNQKNPKALHREPELWNLYMDLLSHRNSEVQKLALDCVASYKYKYLQPYMDHLKGLVDDAKFKATITSFKIDKESGLVQQAHRQQLMPIVMRILFSKMMTRVGGQKTSNQTRKSLIMRFLGGCHEEEILVLLHMSFWMFESEFKDDPRDMCLTVSTILEYAVLMCLALLL